MQTNTKANRKAQDRTATMWGPWLGERLSIVVGESGSGSDRAARATALSPSTTAVITRVGIKGKN